MPQVLPLVMPPAEASPEVAQENKHEEERRHLPVNELLSVQLHVLFFWFVRRSRPSVRPLNLIRLSWHTMYSLTFFLSFSLAPNLFESQEITSKNISSHIFKKDNKIILS